MSDPSSVPDTSSGETAEGQVRAALRRAAADVEQRASLLPAHEITKRGDRRVRWQVATAVTGAAAAAAVVVVVSMTPSGLRDQRPVAPAGPISSHATTPSAPSDPTSSPSNEPPTPSSTMPTSTSSDAPSSTSSVPESR